MDSSRGVLKGECSRRGNWVEVKGCRVFGRSKGEFFSKGGKGIPVHKVEMKWSARKGRIFKKSKERGKIIGKEDREIMSVEMCFSLSRNSSSSVTRIMKVIANHYPRDIFEEWGDSDRQVFTINPFLGDLNQTKSSYSPLKKKSTSLSSQTRTRKQHGRRQEHPCYHYE